MTSDELKTAATGFLPGAVVGAAVVWLAMSMTPAPAPVPTLPSDTKDTETPITETKAAPASASVLDVIDQPAGRAVVVKRLDVAATSWIAVRDYADDKIGNVLGAVRREKGTAQNAVIDLLRATEPGKKYVVVIFTDNGDGEFSTKTDTPLKDSTDTVKAVFTAQTPVAPNGR